MRSKRLNQEKRSSVGGSDRSSGIETPYGRNPDRHVENDSNNHGNPFPEDESYEEEDDFQKAPVYSEAPRNDVNSVYSNGKGAVPPRKSNTVDNLLDGDDSPVASSVINRSPSATMTPVIQRTPSTNTSTPKSYVTPTPVPAPVVEQEQDMFHFDGTCCSNSTLPKYVQTSYRFIKCASIIPYLHSG